MAQQQCVFIIALGRSGSSQLLNLLNHIPGYRISGETDNAWLFLSRLARHREPKLPLCEHWPPFSQRAASRAANLSQYCNRVPRTRRESQERNEFCRLARRESRVALRCHTEKRCHSPRFRLDCPLACGKPCALGTRAPFAYTTGEGANELLCDARATMLQLHNPAPRSRVFGFKEIYSDWVRRADDNSAIEEMLDGGVGFLRGLFPRAKFVFHVRENISGIAASGWWRDEARRTNVKTAAVRERFEHIANHYRNYVRDNPDHSFATTLEGVTLRKKYVYTPTGQREPSQLDRLFQFLGENLTEALRQVCLHTPPG